MYDEQRCLPQLLLAVEIPLAVAIVIGRHADARCPFVTCLPRRRELIGGDFRSEFVHRRFEENQGLSESDQGAILRLRIVGITIALNRPLCACE